MTPDEHAARARDLLRTADEILARAIDENTGLSVENPMVHQQVQTLALLAQAHATLSLHQPGPPPSSAKRSSPVDRRPESRPDRPATDPSGEAGVARLTRWERLSETDFTEFSLPDTDRIDDDLPDLDEATDGPVGRRDYDPPEDLRSDAYGDDDDLPD